jgi:hypothetical protein
MNRPCLDCGTPTTASTCPPCRARREAARDQARGGTTERSYGAQHQAERRAWAIRITREHICCARCHTLINPDDDWALDHTDDRTDYLGPTHVGCNARAGVAKRERLRHGTLTLLGW